MATFSKCLFSNLIKFTFGRRQQLKTLTSILRQNEQHEHIKIMANHGPLCMRINMIKKTSSNQPFGRESECKMVRF